MAPKVGEYWRAFMMLLNRAAENSISVDQSQNLDLMKPPMAIMPRLIANWDFNVMQANLDADPPEIAAILGRKNDYVRGGR